MNLLTDAQKRRFKETIRNNSRYDDLASLYNQQYSLRLMRGLFDGLGAWSSLGLTQLAENLNDTFLWMEGAVATRIQEKLNGR